MVDKIQSLLKQHKRNLVFYFDEDGSFFEELEGIKAAGIQVVEVNRHYFSLKYKLEKEWNNTPKLLYHPFSKPHGTALRKYPLLDLLVANVELRLDDASEFLAAYKLSELHLPLVKKYLKQLKTKTNQKKLARILEPGTFTEPNLKLGLISVVLDFNQVTDKMSCLAKLFSLALEEKGFERKLESLRELELDADLLHWFNMLLDTRAKELNRDTVVAFARKLKYNILTAYIEHPLPEDTYSQLKLQRTADLNKLQAFFQDWENHPQLSKFIEPVFRELAGEIKSRQLMEWYGGEQEYGYYSEEMLTTLIQGLYQNVLTDPVRIKDQCIKWLRSESLSKDLSQQIKFLYHTGGIFGILGHNPSFAYNTAEDFITQYTKELYRVDLNYRKAIIAFDQVRDHLYEFEEGAMQVFTALNSRYDRFLIELNVGWQQILQEQHFDYHQLALNKQYDFFDNNLKGFEYKTVVIISDALRYELGYELYDDLLSDSKNEVTIEHYLASIPSYTNLGMAQLLPHQRIEVQQGETDLVFSINGKTTASTNRADILKMTDPTSTTINFSDVMRFDRDAGREFFRDNTLTYIYHDWIDAIGDKKRTEHETFEATSKAVADIKRLIQKLYGWNVYYVMVTADHGFMFNYNDLPESSREKLPKIKGYGRDHVRFVVAEDFEGSVDGYVFDLNKTTNIETDLKVAIPRAINRYRKQGNVGVQFVHGGASVQELLTPVVKYYKQRREVQDLVTFKRIDQTEKVTSGSIRITMIQDQPVSNEFKSAEVILGIYSDTGELLSNESEIHFNATSPNPKDRIFETILTLNTKGSSASFGHLKAFGKWDKSKLNPLGINDLLKIISLMEKDEF